MKIYKFVSLLGCLAALLSIENYEWIFAISFIGLLFLIVTVYVISAYRRDAGLTTEIVALLSFLMGGIVLCIIQFIKNTVGVEKC